MSINNDIMKIKNEKERFYQLRKFIIGESCKQAKENIREKISVRNFILESLVDDGLPKDDLGTQYIASIATILYHERKLYRRQDITDKSYWDLSYEYNDHYRMLGQNREDVVTDIYGVLEENGYADDFADQIIYDCANNASYHFNRDERRVRYTRQK